jgi:hypothetical protein
MKNLPATENTLLLRTDFSDESAWVALCEAIRAPQTPDEFFACVTPVSDHAYDGATVEQLVARSSPDDHTFILVADRRALADPEHPVLVVDRVHEPGRTFRVIPLEAWAVENNLSLANMDFEEFADNADPDGVFRGFPAAPPQK